MEPNHAIELRVDAPGAPRVDHQKHDGRWHWLSAGLAIAGLAIATFSSSAVASLPPFAIVGPAEWDLPIVPSANVFIQTGIYQTNGSAYDSSGNGIKGPGGHDIHGISRFAHLFSFKALPKVGFFWEYLQPEINNQLPNGTSTTGLGDPLLDGTVYFKPTKNSTLGFQNLLSVPIGSNATSNHAWIEIPTIIADYKIGKLGFDGTLAAGIFSAARQANPVCGASKCSLSLGNFYSIQTSMRYQVLPWLAPFITNIYQIQEPGSVDATDAYIAGSHEDNFGGGVKINFTPGRWLDVWYYKALDGQNTTKENAIYFRFVNIF